MFLLCINELPVETVSFSDDFGNTCALNWRDTFVVCVTRETKEVGREERERERERERESYSHSLLCP